MEPIDADFAKMEERYRDPRVNRDLERLGMRNLMTLLSHHRMSQQRFRELAMPGPLNTAGHQRLEYLAAKNFFRKENSQFFNRHD